MAAESKGRGTAGYRVWLRRGGPTNQPSPGRDRSVQVTEIGHAAAHETFVTHSPHMAAIWTDLFESMLVRGRDLRWARNGPGLGRDARIAYSSLLGRYMARAYLTAHEGVRVLVPLDEAKRRLQGTRYSIEKDPPGRGLEADWIGLDGEGLVIAEAKGTYDSGLRTWRGPSSLPAILRTAIGQAGRTAVVERRRGLRRKLRAKRFAIASRWGTADKPGIEPTLLAWDPSGNRLEEREYRRLASILLGADAVGVVYGLGHREAAAAMSRGAIPERIDNFSPMHIAGQRGEEGFAAVAGPFGVRPLRGGSDRD